MIKLAILALQVAVAIFRYLEERRLISEGERQEMARELARAEKITGLAKKVREQVGKMSDAEVDAALRDDFRD